MAGKHEWEWECEEVGQEEWDAIEQAVQEAEAFFNAGRNRLAANAPGSTGSPGGQAQPFIARMQPTAGFQQPLQQPEHVLMQANREPAQAEAACRKACTPVEASDSSAPGITAASDIPGLSSHAIAAGGGFGPQPLVPEPGPARKPRLLPPSWTSAKPPEAASFPALTFKGEVVIAWTAPQVEACCRELLQAAPEACGFDAEWRALFAKGRPQRPVALVQLCYPKQPTPPDSSEERMRAALLECGRGGAGLRCLLLHVHHSGMTPALKAVLESPHIQLTGVGASGDAFKLEGDFGVKTAAVADVPHLLGSRGIAPPKCSLSSLCEHLLSHTVPKVQSVRCSNWEVPVLSQAQVHYAATDAFASLMVFWAVTSKAPRVAPVQAAQPAATEARQCSQPAPQADAHALELNVGEEPGLMAVHGNRRPLAPAQKEVYHMFVLLEMPIAQIAVERRIKETTVQGYIADAMLHGYAYPWHQLAVPQQIVERMLDACRQHLCAAKLPGAAAPGGFPAPWVDAEAELRSRGLGMKVLKDLLPEWATYGHLRLALAHITRQQQGLLRECTHHINCEHKGCEGT